MILISDHQGANCFSCRSIVNGLRDDDVESYFGGDRTSFASEYSTRDEGVKVFFKEHGRKSSKSSNNSLLGRKKPQGINRPETKVGICLSDLEFIIDPRE